MSIKAIIADVHCHNWSAFAEVNPKTGVNTRLQIILDEIKRAAKELTDAGGNRLFVAGDLFHVRGSIAPTVLNPVSDTLQMIVDSGVEVIIIPGNHDLEGKDSSRVSSAVTALEKVGCHVANSAFVHEDDTLVVPWIENIDDLKTKLLKLADDLSGMRGKMDLIIHAPIDGVIAGLPAHGLVPEWLAGLGFRRVFSGHYHNHKDFGNGVYSVGAIAHHTWSDPGSKAGFLLVGEEVTWFKSQAPEFLDVDSSLDKEEIELTVDRNYVRAKIESVKEADRDALRKWLLESGAKGVLINTVKKPTHSRSTSTVKAGASVEVSVGEFITKSENIDADIKAQVAKESLAILSGIEE